jgi:methionyl-tRNA formyltransferase
MPAPAPRLVMLGTKDFAVPTFVRLVEAGHDVVALITQPDRPQGRKGEILPARIAVEARARGIPVFQPEDLNAPEGLALLSGLRPDLLVTAAYGQILSSAVLTLPPMGGINLHGSILPAYRGAAPVARAIQDGASESGVTVIRMSPRVDAGGMMLVARTPIGPDETAGELEARLAELGAPLIVEAVAALVAGTAVVRKQDRARATRAPKLTKDDGRIDWTRPAQAVHDLVRAMQPWPQAGTQWHPPGDRPPVRLIVHRTALAEGGGAPGTVLVGAPGPLVVAAGAGAVRLVTVQVPGKKPMPAEEFLKGNRVGPGDRMGE